MSEQTITLKPHTYGKLGIIHCGVTHDGFVVVAGDPRDIADGQELVFPRVHVKAKRQGDAYTFSQAA
jgi:hypothetical protein